MYSTRNPASVFFLASSFSLSNLEYLRYSLRKKKEYTGFPSGKIRNTRVFLQEKSGLQVSLMRISRKKEYLRYSYKEKGIPQVFLKEFQGKPVYSLRNFQENPCIPFEVSPGIRNTSGIPEGIFRKTHVFLK